MDTLDVRILRRLFQGQAYSPPGSAFRESLAAMAKNLGVDEDTVRNRLRRFQESGFIPSWRLYVNPHVWGGGQMSAWVDLDPAVPKHGIVERLRGVPGVIVIYTFYDGLAVLFEHDAAWDIPGTVNLIRDVTGAKDPLVARMVFPGGKFLLGPRDWELIQALRRNPWKPYPQLAAEAGVSTRVARARLSKIFAQGLLFAWPALNFRALEGSLLVHLLVWYPQERKAEIDAAIADQLEPCLWNTVHMLPFRPGDWCPCAYNLMVANVPEAQAMLGRVQAVSGVVRTRIYLNEDIHTFFDAYDARLDGKMRGLWASSSAARADDPPRHARRFPQQ